MHCCHWSFSVGTFLCLSLTPITPRNPTPAKTDVIGVEWPAWTVGAERYLEIGDELTVKEGVPLAERMAFWDQASKQVIKDPLYDV